MKIADLPYFFVVKNMTNCIVHKNEIFFKDADCVF